MYTILNASIRKGLVGMILASLLALAISPASPSLASNQAPPANNQTKDSLQLSGGVSPAADYEHAASLPGKNMSLGTQGGSLLPMAGINMSPLLTSNAWSALGTEANGAINAIAVDSIYGTVYAGGEFTRIGSCTSGCNHIAQWDGSTWTPLGSGVNNTVYAIFVYNSTNI